jgi:hypothetical protein
LQKIQDIRQARVEGRIEPATHINIGFSSLGLEALKQPKDIGDEFFLNGMRSHAVSYLGDKPVSPGSQDPDWEADFRQPMHCIILLAAQGILLVHLTFFALTPCCS